METGSPFTWMRSAQSVTCGDVYAPTVLPSAASTAAAIRIVVVLPFVPTT